MTNGHGTVYDDIWLVDGVRTGFADFTSVLADISPTDLGIKVAREALAKSTIAAEDIDMVVAGNMAQSSFDAYFLPRHIGLYAGVPIPVPALLVHRLCGTGFETIIQAADSITLGKASKVLCVGTESMSRNPVASYTTRNGFKMGQVEFKDFLWEATKDTASSTSMGDTAENLAKKYAISREEVDEFAAQSFARAIDSADFRSGEIVPVISETFTREGYNDRGIRLPRGVASFAVDEHVRPTPMEVLSKLKPAFKGVQTGGNSSAVVDGAAAAIVVGGKTVKERGLKPLARIVAADVVGVPPEIMGIGPAPAIAAVVKRAGLTLADIDRFEINEAFGAQYLAVEKELGLDRAKANVNGGAIALGHPLGVTGVRLCITVARELHRRGLKHGIASACIGGGQGVAILIEV
ncbi:acetyl-CoA C-acyltransferase [Paramagnetospirillum kuznetsovii]|uniref:Acetyl-CoA C-acyltransferase n=1 Tax=Paramagnetospirillum kuznetsovii TaxID=2053833 RepID=A0A364P030_9PROT|nr:thiolase family protein [Paramagnetospirillum kuznetsovii]RAU22699.1 acetyl-CoA C-acyltransferase [Paramagnetospirillum kuznetsovii]